MSEPFKQTVRVAVVGLAPVVLAAGLLAHPYLSDVTDAAEIATAIASGSTRWAWSHVLVALGIALTVLAVFAIRMFLRSAGEDNWSFWATGLITIGAGLVLVLIGLDGLGGYAVAEAGGSITGFFEAAAAWEWLFLAAFAVFSLGLIALAVAIRASRVLSPAATWIVVVALVVAAVANFITSFWAAYLTAVVAVVGFWILAWAIRLQPVAPDRERVSQ